MGVLDSLESGLKSILPYALPAALGASLGGPLGGIAGVEAAQPDPDQMLDRQKKQLDIESEQAGLQRGQQQQQAEQRILGDKDFMGSLAQQMGIDPSHLPDLQGMDLQGVEGLYQTVQKAREAGLKGPIIQKDGAWGVQSVNGFTPLGGTPESVVSKNQAQTAANQRNQNTITAAGQRQKTTQEGSNTRAADALAARQTQQRETDIQGIIKGAPAGYRQLLPIYDRMSSLAGDKGYYDYLVNKLSAIPGETMEDAQRRASVEAKYQPKDSVPSGYVSTGRKTKDGKPAYYNPTAKKWWSPD